MQEAYTRGQPLDEDVEERCQPVLGPIARNPRSLVGLILHTLEAISGHPTHP